MIFHNYDSFIIVMLLVHRHQVRRTLETVIKDGTPTMYVVWSKIPIVQCSTAVFDTRNGHGNDLCNTVRKVRMNSTPTVWFGQKSQLYNATRPFFVQTAML